MDIYALGDLGELYHFSNVTSRWTHLGDLPQTVTNIAVCNQTLYVVLEDGAVAAAALALALATPPSPWQAVDNAPPPKHSVAVHGDFVLATGRKERGDCVFRRVAGQWQNGGKQS